MWFSTAAIPFYKKCTSVPISPCPCQHLLFSGFFSIVVILMGVTYIYFFKYNLISLW